MKAGGPHVITITTDKDDRPRTLSEIFVGETWLIVGGADVESRIKENPDRNEVWGKMANVKMSLINLPAATSDKPLDNVRATWRPWDRWRAWERSAVAYFFGNEIQTKLDIPVGTIVAAKPGAPIGTWKASGGPADRAGVYNAMIHPAVGLPIRGIVWCQGAGEAADEAQVKAVIESWSAGWGQKDIALLLLRAADGASRPDSARQTAHRALAETYGRTDVAVKPQQKPDKPAKPAKPAPPAHVPAKSELTVAAVIDPKGDGPDGEGNTADDTWQFWFELGHAAGTYRRLSIATATMSAAERQNGIPRKVTGPVASRLPNPKDTEGWIFHRDWNGTFEGVWGDKKTGKVMLYPYVEKTFHGAVAVTYRVAVDGRHTITGKVTDLMVRPNFPRHDGFFWKVEKAREGEAGEVLARGGPVGDGKGRPDSAEFKIENTPLEAGQLIRLVIHPNAWWGTDLTEVTLTVENPGQ